MIRLSEQTSRLVRDELALALQQASPTPEQTIKNVKRDVHAVQEARHP